MIDLLGTALRVRAGAGAAAGLDLSLALSSDLACSLGLIWI